MATNRIKELRNEKKLTLKDLGTLVGLASNTISQYETGKREPKLATWEKLADIFNYPMDYIQGYPNTEQSQRIRLVLSSNGFNLKDLSKKTKIPLEYLQDLEKGQAENNENYIFELAHLFELPEWYLAGKVEQENVDPDDDEKDPSAQWFDELPEMMKIDSIEQHGYLVSEITEKLQTLSKSYQNRTTNDETNAFIESAYDFLSQNSDTKNIDQLARIIRNVNMYNFNFGKVSSEESDTLKAQIKSDFIKFIDNLQAKNS